MTIQAAFTLIINTLGPLQGNREAANIAHIVIEHITGMGRMDRVIYKDKLLSPAQEEQLQQALNALLKHEPVQYVTGKAWFYGLEFTVNRNVLIPRPETEELVEWIVKDTHTPVKILDIGTGSGAIPIALKKDLPAATVWSVDVSAGALEVASQNATQLNLNVHFEQIDILDTTATHSLPLFDIIVSNPPYICESEQKDMEEQVIAYEPRIALFVPDNDALLFYRQIGLLAKEKLVPGGLLYFEINEAFGKEVVALLEKQGFKNVILKQDLYTKDRMVRGEN
ncbi:peptide chain release factor N(5)-glutamine methyltransferase [Chitinophaga oryziterrae]|uniref:Release factor glutamine methyltransferase n=1 Tax=Chitinophaga oryziterrae TaxID=1031224 RepID=A0A6N8J3E4_9BACT|nr:peptide chain release factor N(5)-glutamine methyltransferase [Chitinophaga oryziterrae]MVT39725.1 peptide chain release factor N(5)-glutamine methyltransferase [Chitinophaga oryziterrae]